jgi:hypothetical protein
MSDDPKTQRHKTQFANRSGKAQNTIKPSLRGMGDTSLISARAKRTNNRDPCVPEAYMQRSKRFLLVAIQLLLLVLPVAAAEKKAISLKHSGEDSVGNRFVYALREEIAKSARYSFFSGDKLQLPADTNIIEVEVVSVAADHMSPPVSSAISVLITLTVQRPAEQRKTCGNEVGLNLYHGVYVVGADQSDQSAKEFMAQLDKTMHAD